jgi:hypothetical protein
VRPGPSLLPVPKALSSSTASLAVLSGNPEGADRSAMGRPWRVMVTELHRHFQPSPPGSCQIDCVEVTLSS